LQNKWTQVDDSKEQGFVIDTGSVMAEERLLPSQGFLVFSLFFIFLSPTLFFVSLVFVCSTFD